MLLFFYIYLKSFLISPENLTHIPALTQGLFRVAGGFGHFESDDNVRNLGRVLTGLHNIGDRNASVPAAQMMFNHFSQIAYAILNFFGSNAGDIDSILNLRRRKVITSLVEILLSAEVSGNQFKEFLR